MIPSHEDVKNNIGYYVISYIFIVILIILSLILTGFYTYKKKSWKYSLYITFSIIFLYFSIFYINVFGYKPEHSEYIHTDYYKFNKIWIIIIISTFLLFIIVKQFMIKTIQYNTI